MNIVEVKWGDAWIDTTDINFEDAKKLKPIVRYTIGFLVADNEDSLILCTDYYDEDKTMVNAPMVIPKGMVMEYWIYEFIEDKSCEPKRSDSHWV
jgi:hypothetical protein